jgi:hypothetical protein
MTKTYLTVFLLSTVACSKAGTLDIGGGATDDTGTNGTTGTTDTSSTTDTSGTSTTETNVFEELVGNYRGEITLFLWGGGWDSCAEENEGSFNIAEDGSIEGTANCYDGWADYPHEFTGQVDENFDVNGVVSISSEFSEDGAGVYDFYFNGEIEDGELSISWDGEADMGDWSIEVNGSAVAD